jgi:uncharacterized repeat protein (TIGR04076 family)|tara:strand:+ start:43 stop:144 length:102 start_codon:yes stop_codon:yes gene_type:complete
MKIKIEIIKSFKKCPRSFNAGNESIIEDGKTPK